jgi:hypothetical protein
MNSAPSKVVDIYSAGVWTNTTISQARYSLAGATTGPKAVFAGGYMYSLMHARPLADVVSSGGLIASNAVDIFDGSIWTTATLSLARYHLAGASVSGKVLFAGGSL